MKTTYNLEANGKIEKGHSLIVKALAKACKGKVGNWPKVLPYALWADRTTQFGDRIYADRAHDRANATMGIGDE